MVHWMYKKAKTEGMFFAAAAAYRKDERMRRYKVRGRDIVQWFGMLVAAVTLGFGTGKAAPGGCLSGYGENQVVYAAEDMLGYKNPERIVIASPGTNPYSTTASQISILGACDYRYPLFMNGETVETTAHGFFTAYVTLSEGENVFLFENGEQEYKLTVTRKKTSGGSSETEGASKYKAVSNKMGELRYPYTMPYSAPGKVKIEYLPLTENTTFRIVGEWGNYYKLPDGTYVEKSAVKVYPYKLPSNRIRKASAVYDEMTRTLETTFTMKIDALYDVQLDGNTVKFVLYDTTAGAGVSVPDNPLVKSVSECTDANNKAVYTYTLYDAEKLCGFDVRTENGVMTFILKYAPVLKEQGSLEGAVILLDAGHGGTDNGTVGAMGTAGPTEKTVNLDLMKRVKKALEEMGATVVTVRSTDVYYTLNERVELIRKTKPDLSVSIHGNAMGITSDYSKSSGFLTFYSYNNVQDAAGVMNAYINKSMGYTERSIRKANLSLTRLTTCPAVLLESALLTNPEDYEYLLNASNREALAQAIAEGAREYLESVAVYEQERTHTVRYGETLSGIAKCYGVTVNALAAANDIANINLIRSGSVLKIPKK